MKGIIKALKLAESLEQSRADTYEKYLQVVDFPAGKKVLSFLVKAETSHLKFLKLQEERLEKGEKILFSKLHKPEISMPDKEYSLKNSILSLTSDIGILRIVQNLEEDDVKFYQNLLKLAKTEESIKLFNSMIDIEKSHLMMIKKVIKQAEEANKAIAKNDPKILFKKLMKAKKK